MYLPEERLAGVGIFAPPPGTGLLGTLLPRSLEPVRIAPSALGTAPAGSSRGKRNGLHFFRKTDVEIRLWYLAILWVGCCAIGLSITSPSRSAFSYYLSLAWSIYFPVAAVGSVGAVLARGKRGPRWQRSTCAESVHEQVIILVPTLAHSANLPALKRVLTSICDLAWRNLSNYRIDVVIDEGDEDVCATVQALKDWLGGTELVQLLVVPGNYQTPRGARYKTRANHYALEHRRTRRENTSSTYVYHLDDDTSMGVDTVASIAEFIAGNRNGDHLLAQGVLAFPNELSPSWLSNMADSIRPADDLTRFNLFTETFGVPLGGLHGEHLLVRADIEDDIGWDYPDTVIEDALFALRFANRYPGRSTTLNSFSYGASPATITDLVKQRRRWSEGLLKLIFKRDIPLLSRLPLIYCVLAWVSSPFQFVGLLLPLSFILDRNGASPVHSWVIVLWSFNLAFLLWSYALGYRINNVASARPRSPWCSLALPVTMFVLSGIESYAVLLGLLRALHIVKGQEASEVIYKPC